MQCVSIDSLVLSSRSLVAIKDIERRTHLSSVLKRVMSAGTMVNIFAGNGVMKSGFFVTQTDFEALSKAIAALPNITRRVIRDIADRQQLLRSGKEREFWRGVANGCST